MTDLEQKENEYHAKQLLDNPVFLALLEEVNKGINRDMDSVKPDDIKTMQGLVLMRQALNKVVGYVVNEAESGKITDFNAKPKRKLFNRA